MLINLQVKGFLPYQQQNELALCSQIKYQIMSKQLHIKEEDDPLFINFLVIKEHNLNLLFLKLEDYLLKLFNEFQSRLNIINLNLLILIIQLFYLKINFLVYFIKALFFLSFRDIYQVCLNPFRNFNPYFLVYIIIFLAL